MHERVQQCREPLTDFAFLHESLGVRRTNHILRVQGHTILQEQRATNIYDEVGQRSLERLFPGFTEDSMTQATPRLESVARERETLRLQHTWELS